MARVATVADMSFVPGLLTHLDAAVAKDGWDQPARLYGVYAEEISDGMMAVGAADFPGFDLAYMTAGCASHALVALRLALDMDPPVDWAARMEGLFALVLVDEAWTVRRKAGQPAPDVPLADVPGAREQRMTIFYAFDGSTKILTRERNDDTTCLGGHPGVRIVDEMRRLLAAIAGDGTPDTLDGM